MKGIRDCGHDDKSQNLSEKDEFVDICKIRNAASFMFQRDFEDA